MLVEPCLKSGPPKGLFSPKVCSVKKSIWPKSVWLKSQFSHKSVQPATPLPQPHRVTCLWSPILALNIIQNCFIRMYCDSYYISDETHHNWWLCVCPFLQWTWVNRSTIFGHLGWSCQERSMHESKARKDLWRRCCDWWDVSEVDWEVWCWRFLGCSGCMGRWTTCSGEPSSAYVNWGQTMLWHMEFRWHTQSLRIMRGKSFVSAQLH